MQEELYEVVIQHGDVSKRLVTKAVSEEDAASKFNRHIVCQWVGYPWEDPEDLLDGTIDKIENDGSI